MSAPNKGRGVLSGLLLSGTLVASGVGAWRILAVDQDGAALAAVAGAACVVASSLLARGPFWTFLDAIAYRVFDAAFLGCIAWVTHQHGSPAAGPAILALAAGFLGSYIVARGRALGYSIWGSTVNRGIRSGLVAVALLADDGVAWLWALAIFSILTVLVRASQAFKEERA